MAINQSELFRPIDRGNNQWIATELLKQPLPEVVGLYKQMHTLSEMESIFREEKYNTRVEGNSDEEKRLVVTQIVEEESPVDDQRHTVVVETSFDTHGLQRSVNVKRDGAIPSTLTTYEYYEVTHKDGSSSFGLKQTESFFLQGNDKVRTELVDYRPEGGTPPKRITNEHISAMFPLLFPEPGQEHAEEMQENLQRAIEKAQKGEVPALIYAKEGADKVVLHLFDMARGLGLGGGLTSLYDYKFEITKNNIGRWQVDKRTTFSTQLVGAGTQKMYETIPTPPLVVTYTYENGRLETSKRVGDFIRVSVKYNEAGEKIKEEIEDLPIPVE